MSNIQINSFNNNLQINENNNNVKMETTLPILDMSSNKTIEMSSKTKELNINANRIINTGSGKVNDVLVNGESVLDEEGNANIEISNG